MTDTVDASEKLFTWSDLAGPDHAGIAKKIVDSGRSKTVPWDCDTAVTFPSRLKLAAMIEQALDDLAEEIRDDYSYDRRYNR